MLSGTGSSEADPLVSIILPTLNEEYVNRSLLRLASHLLGIEGHRFELLLVDDSSEANRRELRACVAQYGHLAPRITLRVVDGGGRGKGNAVKLGAKSARGELVFVVDADLPVPLRHIEEFLRILEDGNDVVIGARPILRDFGRPVRQTLSRVLALLVQAVVFEKATFSDTQCGFKAFRATTLRSLAEKQRVDGGMYDVEYLCAALLEGRKVFRVPVTQEPETRPSKIKVWKCLYTDPVALLRIKARALSGAYGPRTGRPPG